MPARTADARWEGTLQDGAGTMRLGGGAYEGPYSFASRFEDGKGTNPEELVAAAHAGCFSMALSGALGRAGFTPTAVETSAAVHLEKQEAGFRIGRIVLTVRATVPGIDDAKFQELAEATKTGCPISAALAAVPQIEVDAQLVS